MSRVLEIQERILDTTAEITRLERALAQRDSRALNSSLRSLYKFRAELESEFRDAAASAQLDVVSYRLFEGRERPTMALVGKAMDSFQTLYAILYAAVSSKRPRDTARLSAYAIQQSSFEFAYAFSGSVGFMFTMPNERLLFGDTELDEAMRNLFALARSATRDDIRHFARTFGLAAVRALHHWADSLSTSQTGADIEWKKAEDARDSLILQPAQVEALRDLIAQTTDVETHESSFGGVILGFDYKTRHFRFVPDSGGPMITGYASDRAELPARLVLRSEYTATLRITKKIRYSLEKAEVTHELLALREQNED
jgi:hypothetical protein